MIRLTQIIAFVLMSLTFYGLQAQTDSSYRFTLSEAQDFAIDNYFVTKNAELDIEIAKKKIWETTAIGLPQVSGSAGWQYIPGEIPEFSFGSDDPNDPFNQLFAGAINAGWIDPATMGGDGGGSPISPKSTINYSVTLSQLIFSGEYIVGLQAAKVYSTFAQENFDKIRIDLKESIAGTYYSIKIIEKNVEVLSETLENLKLNYEHTSKFFEQGLVEDTDVDQLGLVVKRTENSLSMVKRQQEYLLKMFKYQIGVDAATEVILTDSITGLIDLNIIGDEQYSFSLDENIDYKMLSTQEDLMSLSMKREKSTFLPTLSGFYQYSDKTEKSDLDFTIQHVIGLNLAVPIFSSGMRMSKVGQAKIELEKTSLMKEQEAQRLVLTAEQAQYDYNTALQSYYNEKENYELSERVFNKANVRFKEGMVSALDLSMINNQYLEAQLSYATAMQELLMTKIALDKAFNKL